MKNVSPALQALLLRYMRGELRTLYCDDLYEFTLNSGRVLRFTKHDTSLTVGGNVYKSWPFDGGEITEQVGTDETEMTLTVYYKPTDEVISGVTWANALRGGMFDNCYLSVDRVYQSTPWSYLPSPTSSDYVLKGRFVGRVDVGEAKLTKCDMTVKSPLGLLDSKVPRNLIIPSCGNVLFDPATCMLNKASYAVSGVAGTGSGRTSIVTGLGHADGYLEQGFMLFTSGDNTDIQRTIGTFSGGVAYFFQPLPFDVSVGDTFVAYPGCKRTMDDCVNKYNNLAHFKGFPFVPSPESAI